MSRPSSGQQWLEYATEDRLRMRFCPFLDPFEPYFGPFGGEGFCWLRLALSCPFADPFPLLNFGGLLMTSFVRWL